MITNAESSVFIWSGKVKLISCDSQCNNNGGFTLLKASILVEQNVNNPNKSWIQQDIDARTQWNDILMNARIVIEKDPTVRLLKDPWNK